MEKGKKNEEIDHKLNYVRLDVISMLFGIPVNTLYQDEAELDNVRFILDGRGRRIHFGDAARLIYPDLTDYEVGMMRIDINNRLKKKVGRRKR